MTQPTIVTLICNPFHKLVGTNAGMTTEQRELFMQVSAMPESMDDLPPATLNQLKYTSFAKVQALSTLFTVDICFRTKFWITCITNGNMGHAFMYLAYVQYQAKQKKVFEVNFRWFCEKLFPEGFVSSYDLLPLFPALAQCTKPEDLEPINYTAADLKLYQEAKDELRHPMLLTTKQETNNQKPETKLNVMSLLKSNAWLINLK